MLWLKPTSPPSQLPSPGFNGHQPQPGLAGLVGLEGLVGLVGRAFDWAGLTLPCPGTPWHALPCPALPFPALDTVLRHV